MLYKNGIPKNEMLHNIMPRLGLKSSNKLANELVKMADLLKNLDQWKDLQFSGYITKGDSTGNPHPDQLTHRDIEGNVVQPTDPDWVVGKARGELPWFGLIKLKVTQPENYDNAPSECKTMLWLSMFLILAGPFTVGKIWENYSIQTSKKNKSKR